MMVEGRCEEKRTRGKTKEIDLLYIFTDSPVKNIMETLNYLPYTNIVYILVTYAEGTRQ